MSQVTIKVLFFAQARELSGLSRAELKLDAQILGRDLLNRICESFNLDLIKESVILSIDEQYCDDLGSIISLRDNSEVAVIPPISGG